MTRPKFPIFSSHLDLAHKYWSELLKQGSVVIDATSGNGHDALFLGKLTLSEEAGSLYCIDLQDKAIENTRKLLQDNLSEKVFERVIFIQRSHETLPEVSCDLIVYNLGYLPGGDKGITTCCESTIASIQSALRLLKRGGALSITCYPGHLEGKRELDLIIEYIKTLPPAEYLVCYHFFQNRNAAPSLVMIFKAC